VTAERTQAYARVMKTLREVGPAKLQPGEQDRIRASADTLVLAADLDEAREALRDLAELTERLIATGRWTEERADGLVEDLLACGPVEPVA
jgi:hypothetical protein